MLVHGRSGSRAALAALLAGSLLLAPAGRPAAAPAGGRVAGAGAETPPRARGGAPGSHASAPPRSVPAPGPQHEAGEAIPRAQPRGALPEDSARVIHLLQRATYGIRPGDVEAVLRVGIERWLDEQLHPERIDDRALERRIEAFPAARMSPAEAYAAYPPPALVRRQMQAAGMDSAALATREVRRRLAQRSPARILADLVGAKLTRAVYSERQLEEVMTDFWFDHFNVFFNKNQDRYLVGAFEREAIRPHVFGRFEDMLIATAQHPAMLIYLDNWTSAVPDSLDPRAQRRRQRFQQLAELSPAERERLLQRRGASPEQIRRIEELLRRVEAGELPAGGRRRKRGINENYARELLELHTLGVDGGYTQQDVIEVARAFTGWTITTPRRQRALQGEVDDEAFRFVFRPEMHDRGEKTVLGHRLPAGRGIEDGRDVLRMLARHPSTARHIATKLAERFVSDTPPPALVAELARVFLETDGDLREVTRTLFLSETFYDPAYRGTKVKRPFELVASAYRVTGAEVGFSRRTLAWLRTFGHMPYLQSAPTGYPASSEEWVNSGAMLNRLNFALAFAAGQVDGVRYDRQALFADASGAELVARLADRLLPGSATEELERVVLEDIAALAAAPAGPAAEHVERARPPQEPAAPGRARRARAAAAPDVRDPHARALGLVLGSPEFQKH
ncbi:MAG TPA: DUF1800 domain-containing protein [Longimicrobiales bacterium]